MKVTLSKSDYLVFRECPKNAWLKIHKPEVYFESELSEFEKSIIETGNEVELVARKLFPTGVMIEGRDKKAEKMTQDYIASKQPTLFQPVFVKDNFLAVVDVLKFDAETASYSVYEIKSTNEVDDKTHFHDLAFQINLLKKFGLKIAKTYLIHLNSDYVRSGDLDIGKLFEIADVTQEIESLSESVSLDADKALAYLSQESEPKGFCSCIYKGRSKHCSTFGYANPQVPEYSVHDIARIGSSKAKLQELIDGSIFNIHEIPDHIKLSEIQKNQVDAHVLDRVIVKKDKISEEFQSLIFPLYFLDYETFPCAIPRFDGFSPYQQIPFQYSLHVLKSEEDEPKHFDFLFTESGDPSGQFTASLQKHIGNVGSIIAWHKSFECGRNNELGERIPKAKSFLDSINARVYDLEDIFKNQYYVHKDFKGSTSIKKILPVLAPKLSYKELEIQEGGTAAETWNKITSGSLNKVEKEKSSEDLRAYCERDTYAMYAIWNALNKTL